MARPTHYITAVQRIALHATDSNGGVFVGADTIRCSACGAEIALSELLKKHRCLSARPYVFNAKAYSPFFLDMHICNVVADAFRKALDITSAQHSHLDDATLELLLAERQYDGAEAYAHAKQLVAESRALCVRFGCSRVIRCREMP